MIKAMEKKIDKDLEDIIKSNPKGSDSLVDKILNDEPFSQEEVEEFEKANTPMPDEDDTPDLDDETLDKIINGDIGAEIDEFLKS